MGRILAIDYGRRRCGLAVTDELRLVGSPLETVETSGVIDFIRRYIARNKVDIIIIGEPTTLRGAPSESARYIEGFIPRLRAILPEGMEIARYDERFTSTLAHRAMIDGGLGRMARRDKALVDRTAATIILNDYLQSIYNK